MLCCVRLSKKFRGVLSGHMGMSSCVPSLWPDDKGDAIKCDHQNGGFSPCDRRCEMCPGALWVCLLLHTKFLSRKVIWCFHFVRIHDAGSFFSYLLLILPSRVLVLHAASLFCVSYTFGGVVRWVNNVHVPAITHVTLPKRSWCYTATLLMHLWTGRKKGVVSKTISL